MKPVEINNYRVTNKRKKIPLGLTPKYVRLLERQNEIKLAIIRYINEDCDIPIKWIEEYNENCKEIKE